MKLEAHMRPIITVALLLATPSAQAYTPTSLPPGPSYIERMLAKDVWWRGRHTETILSTPSGEEALALAHMVKRREITLEEAKERFRLVGTLRPTSLKPQIRWWNEPFASK